MFTIQNRHTIDTLAALANHGRTCQGQPMSSTETISAILEWIALYALIGGIVSALFLLFGVTRIDHAAKGTGILFKLMVLPGLVALWPLVILRWLSGGQPHGD
jgi:hypothetical protein